MKALVALFVLVLAGALALAPGDATGAPQVEGPAAVEILEDVDPGVEVIAPRLTAERSPQGTSADLGVAQPPRAPSPQPPVPPPRR